MAIGDENDVRSRLDQTLPPWFNADETPVLDGLLSAYANIGSFLYSQSAYVELQTRISSATGDNLELIANDFFGPRNFQRYPNESDANYRNRIKASVLRERATRRGMVNIITMLTGFAPIIFEPSRGADCGGYNIGGMGYNVAGGWSYVNPADSAYQCFITVFTPVISTIAYVAGWGIPTGAWTISGTRSSWTDRFNFSDAVNEQQINQGINSTKVEGTVCWVRYQSS